jgi:hypothetical protein
MNDFIGFIGQGLFMFFAIVAAYDAVWHKRTLPFLPAAGFTLASALNLYYAVQIHSTPLITGMACNLVCWGICSGVAYVASNK